MQTSEKASQGLSSKDQSQGQKLEAVREEASVCQWGEGMGDGQYRGRGLRCTDYYA